MRIRFQVFNGFALGVSVLLWLAVPLELSAQHTVRYRLIDLGTLGGPISYGSANGDGGRMLNNAGVVSSLQTRRLADPFAPDFCFDPDCLLAHAYRWRNGVMTDLGSLADGFNSLAPRSTTGAGVSAHRKPESLTLLDSRKIAQRCG